MTYKEKKEIIMTWLDNVTDEELLEYWNNYYCNEMDYPDDVIYNNDVYFVNNAFESPYEALEAAANGYNIKDWYVQYDGYGWPITSSDLTDFINYDKLADFILADKWNLHKAEEYMGFDVGQLEE